MSSNLTPGAFPSTEAFNEARPLNVGTPRALSLALLGRSNRPDIRLNHVGHRICDALVPVLGGVLIAQGRSRC